MPYLLKSEPDKYSYDDLQRDGETVWDGIKNAQALNWQYSFPAVPLVGCPAHR
jgi:predicted RNA-binding protein with PUA-like domain